MRSIKFAGLAVADVAVSACGIKQDERQELRERMAMWAVRAIDDYAVEVRSSLPRPKRHAGGPALEAA